MNSLESSNKNSILDAEETDKKEESRESNLKIGTGMVRDMSISASIHETNLKYTKPDYNPTNRRLYYDDSKAHKEVIDKAFLNNEEVRDRYTNALLEKKQIDAKIKFGTEWQAHSAEADHIVPINKVVNNVNNSTFKKAFLTDKDVKEVVNSEENFQVISRKLNQSSKDIGKGGSTQEEWSNDQRRMKGIEKYIETNESIDSVRGRIRNDGIEAEKRLNQELLKRSMKNAAKVSYQSGKYVAVQSGMNTFAMSGVSNIVAVIKGEKSCEDALEDTAIATGKAAASGFVIGGTLVPISQLLSNTSSPFIQGLVKSNVPGKIISAVIVTGDTLKQWSTGEITTQECIIRLGDKGLNMATIGYSAGIGQALIPIPVLGAAIGTLVGSALTSNLYNSLVGKLQQKQLEHEERLRIIEECNAIAEQHRMFRKEMEAYLESYFKEYKTCFNNAISSMKLAYQSGDAEGVVLSANTITRKLGGNVQYDTFEEFKNFIDSNSIDIL